MLDRFNQISVFEDNTQVEDPTGTKATVSKPQMRPFKARSASTEWAMA